MLPAVILIIFLLTFLFIMFSFILILFKLTVIFTVAASDGPDGGSSGYFGLCDAPTELSGGAARLDFPRREPLSPSLRR
jgi:hypothetical protein